MADDTKLVKHTDKQSFWLGATTATAVVFGLLLLGVMGGKVSFDGQASGGNRAPAAANDDTAPVADDYPAEAEAEDIVIEPVSDDDWVRGSRDAEINIIEFSDLECPFCGRVHPTVQSIIDDPKYAGKVNWVYRHFPLPFHPQAEPAAIAAECVGELGGNDAFWVFLDEIFAKQGSGLSAAAYSEAAAVAGVNATAFDTCVAEGRYADKVADHTEQAGAAGGTGTPHSIIVSGDELIPVRGAVPRAQFEAILDPLVE